MADRSGVRVDASTMYSAVKGMPMKPSLLRALFAVVLCSAGPVAQGQDHRPAQGATEHKPDHMRHSFADVERYAASFDNPARDAWQMPDRVIAALALRPGQRVADIGAGTGYFSIRLARSAAAPKVFAVDVEEAMVQHIQQRALDAGLRNLIPIRTTADRANLFEPVDVALVVNTYHHISNRVGYFSDLKAFLRPGGRLAIIDFRKDSPEGPPVEFRFSAEQISNELAQAGYTLQTSHDFLPRQLFLIYVVK